MSWQAAIIRLYLRYGFKARRPAEVSAHSMRKSLARSLSRLPAPPAGVRVESVDVSGVRALRVSAPSVEASRAVLYLHGGGYVSGSPETHLDLVWRLSAAVGCPVLSIDYRLAPEHPFPAAIDDATAAYRWLLERGHAPGALALAGDSAGGGLAFATLLRLREEGVALPAAVCGFSPWTDLAATGASVEENRDRDPMIHHGLLRSMAAHYLAGRPAEMPFASPLYGDLRGLPPTLLHVGSTEVLLDDARRLAERLEAAGVPVTLRVFTELPHVFQIFAAFVPESRAAIAEAGDFLRGHMKARATPAAAAG